MAARETLKATLSIRESKPVRLVSTKNNRVLSVDNCNQFYIVSSEDEDEDKDKDKDKDKADNYDKSGEFALQLARPGRPMFVSASAKGTPGQLTVQPHLSENEWFCAKPQQDGTYRLCTCSYCDNTTFLSLPDGDAPARWDVSEDKGDTFKTVWVPLPDSGVGAAAVAEGNTVNVDKIEVYRVDANGHLIAPKSSTRIWVHNKTDVKLDFELWWGDWILQAAATAEPGKTVELPCEYVFYGLLAKKDNAVVASYAVYGGKSHIHVEIVGRLADGKFKLGWTNNDEPKEVAIDAVMLRELQSLKAQQEEVVRSSYTTASQSGSPIEGCTSVYQGILSFCWKVLLEEKEVQVSVYVLGLPSPIDSGGVGVTQPLEIDTSILKGRLWLQGRVLWGDFIVRLFTGTAVRWCGAIVDFSNLPLLSAVATGVEDASSSSEGRGTALVLPDDWVLDDKVDKGPIAPKSSTRIWVHNETDVELRFELWWWFAFVSAATAGPGESVELPCEYVFYDLFAKKDNVVVASYYTLHGANSHMCAKRFADGKFTLVWADHFAEPEVLTIDAAKLRELHSLKAEQEEVVRSSYTTASQSCAPIEGCTSVYQGILSFCWKVLLEEWKVEVSVYLLGQSTPIASGRVGVGVTQPLEIDLRILKGRLWLEGRVLWGDFTVSLFTTVEWRGEIVELPLRLAVATGVEDVSSVVKANITPLSRELRIEFNEIVGKWQMDGVSAADGKGGRDHYKFLGEDGRDWRIENQDSGPITRPDGRYLSVAVQVGGGRGNVYAHVMLKLDKTLGAGNIRNAFKRSQDSREVQTLG